jgi:hypothetical protein
VSTVRYVASALALVVAAPVARAQVVIEERGGAGTVYPKSDWPTQSLPRQPLTLAAGQLELGVPVRIDVSSTRPADVPTWNIPLYLDLGLTNFLQLGIFHGNAPGQGPLAPVPGLGLCFAGTSDGCPNTYDDIGARVRLGVARVAGAGQLALEGRVQAFGFNTSSDFTTALNGTQWLGSVGAIYKHTLGRLAILLDADWTSRLNKRDLASYADQIAAGVGAQLELVPGLSAYGQAEWAAPVNKNTTTSNITANTTGPFVVGAELVPLKQVALGADLRFRNLLGEDATGDDRQLTLYARLFL